MIRTGKKYFDSFIETLERSKYSGFFEFKLGREESKIFYNEFSSFLEKIQEKENKIKDLQEEIIELQRKIQDLQKDQVITITIDGGEKF